MGLRPVRRRDAGPWRDIRRLNDAWLSPWEATAPVGVSTSTTFAGMVSYLRREARAGRMLPFVITYDGRFVGQVTVGSIHRGSLSSTTLGYWVDQAYAGRGLVPTAVALAVDHCFGPVGLHRVEVNVRPENTASLRVVEKLGFVDEGMRRRLLHIDGDWRDHRCFVLLAEDLEPGGVLARWRRTRAATG